MTDTDEWHQAVHNANEQRKQQLINEKLGTTNLGELELFFNKAD